MSRDEPGFDLDARRLERVIPSRAPGGDEKGVVVARVRARACTCVLTQQTQVTGTTLTIVRTIVGRAPSFALAIGDSQSLLRGAGVETPWW